MISLGSCKGPRFKPVVLKDIDYNMERCRVRCYDLNTLKTIPGEKCEIIPGNYPLENCAGMAGFSFEEIADEIKPRAEKIIQYYKDKNL